ncbi:hypothetical protein, partial [Xanthomonas hortorum]|uniref:hypothetical protein n=1 Tax=Xanthomonas hortorum TaxID=56454 RepID=UPI001CEF8B3D
NQPLKNRPIRPVQSPSKTANSFGAVECSQTKRIAGVMLSPLPEHPMHPSMELRKGIHAATRYRKR